VGWGGEEGRGPAFSGPHLPRNKLYTYSMQGGHLGKESGASIPGTVFHDRLLYKVLLLMDYLIHVAFHVSVEQE